MFASTQLRRAHSARPVAQWTHASAPSLARGSAKRFYSVERDSRGRTGQLLLVAAAAVPLGFGAAAYFKPEWVATLKDKLRLPSSPAPAHGANKFSAAKDSSASAPAQPLVLPEVEPLPAPVTTPKPVPREFDPAKLRRELDDLESRLSNAAAARVAAAAAAKRALEQKAAEATSAVAAEAKKVESAVANVEPAIKAAESAAAEATAVSREALEDLRTKARAVSAEAERHALAQLEASEASIRADLERVLAHDLSTLDTMGLRERVVQLILELKDRNKWEALRAHELVTKTTQELSNKYAALLQDQERAYEEVVRAEAGRAAFAADASAQEHYGALLQERLARQKELLRLEMERLVGLAREEERAIADEERAARAQALNEIQANLQTLGDFAKSKERSTLKLRDDLRAAAAALGLARVALLDMSTGEDASARPKETEKRVSALRVAAAGDEVVEAALHAIPARAYAGGVPSIPVLARRFERVKDDLKSSALYTTAIPFTAPEKLTPGSLVSDLKSKVTGALNLATSTNDAEAAQLAQSETLINLATSKLETGDLASAVAAVEKLPPKQLEFARDWLAQAKDRLAFESSLLAIVGRVESWAREA